MLVFDNHKANGLGRRLPISEATAAMIGAHERRVRWRDGRTGVDQLSCLPTSAPPTGAAESVAAFSVAFHHRDWTIGCRRCTPTDGAERPGAKRRHMRQLLCRLSHERLSLVGTVLIAVVALATLAAPLVSPDDPTAVNITARLVGSSLRHPLGTDELGRDLLSRLTFGARWSLGGALLVTVGVTIMV